MNHFSPYLYPTYHAKEGEKNRKHRWHPAVAMELETGLQSEHLHLCTSPALMCEHPGGSQLTPPSLSFFLCRMWIIPLLFSQRDLSKAQMQ